MLGQYCMLKQLGLRVQMTLVTLFLFDPMKLLGLEGKKLFNGFVREREIELFI
jgi:hypothetical protein